MTYRLKCLICHQHEDTNLVRIQEHAISSHGYTQADHYGTRQREIEPGRYIFTFPDGTDWLEAIRTSDDVIGGI